MTEKNKEDVESYRKIILKVPEQTSDYDDCSVKVVELIELMMKDAMDNGRNKIIINTNLKKGIPMENVNKIAGPFIEAWAFETFYDYLETKDGRFKLVNVEAGERLNMADVLLQFKIERERTDVVSANVDVKATSNDIVNSGRAPNITSFSRIRTAYIVDPDYIFVILSIKHNVYSTIDDVNKMMLGVMEVIDFKAYDLKYISESDLSYNPALGTGQIQIKDIHYVNIVKRTTKDFCELLDMKFLKSKKGFSEWLLYAKQNKWIKE